MASTQSGQNHRGREFDLNIEKVLEGWQVSHAIRELIANALDEQALSGTEDVLIAKRQDEWAIRDFGRGIRYEHLTQNENPEKLENAEKVVGRFGVGLKDALAVLHRHGIDVRLKSRFGDITLTEQAKAQFDDVVTLHARIATASEPAMRGTEVVLRGVGDDDMRVAQRFFLRFSGEHLLEATRYGAILQRRPERNARIYVNGLVVAEEDNFLFSYNITSLTAPMKKALNRERTNVGRTAYAERVKTMLLSAESGAVARSLASDLTAFADGTCHDETKWSDVQVRACQVLSAEGNVVFVSAAELSESRSMVDMAIREGRTIVTVPTRIADAIEVTSDVKGQPIATLRQFAAQWCDSFQFDFVEPDQLRPDERRIFDLTSTILQLSGGKPSSVRSVRVSNTMRPSLDTSADANGLWQPSDGTIIVHRPQLRSLREYAGTLLHEAVHARTGYDDVSREFELALTSLIGLVAERAISR